MEIPDLLPLLTDDDGKVLEDLVHLTHGLFNFLYALLPLRNHGVVELQVTGNLHHLLLLRRLEKPHILVVTVRPRVLFSRRARAALALQRLRGGVSETLQRAAGHPPACAARAFGCRRPCPGTRTCCPCDAAAPLRMSRVRLTVIKVTAATTIKVNL